MGAKASTARGGSGAAPSPVRLSAGSPAAAWRGPVSFPVRAPGGSGATAAPLLLRIDREAVTLVDATTQAILRAYEYHRILCWGHTEAMFSFKVYGLNDAGGRVGSRTSSPAKGSQPAVLRAVTSRDAYTQAAAMVGGPPDEAGAGGAADPVEDDGLVPPHVDAHAVETVRFETAEGDKIADELMATIRHLMVTIDARGVPDEDFTTLVSELEGLVADPLLAAEGLGGSVALLEAVSQVCLTRAFDARQCIQLVKLVAATSPFDAVEAAVTLFPACLHPLDSFHVVLDECFADPLDRDNVCHRVGVKMGPGGLLVSTRKAEKTLAAAAAAASGAAARR